MKKVLLIGGAGFIGFNIAKFLAKNRDYEITIADNFFRAGGKMDDLLSELVSAHDIKVVAGDFTVPKAFDALGRGYDYVYMLAYTSKNMATTKCSLSVFLMQYTMKPMMT